MPTNIHIGISGSANTAAAQAQLDKLQAKFALLDKQMHATMLSGQATSGQITKDLGAIGRQFAGLAANTGQWQTVQKRVNDQTVQLTENLLKQKATYKDIAAARKSGLLELARQEQLRLRNAQVSTLGRTPAGQHYAQMMIPSSVADGMDNMNRRLGFQSALLKSASTQMVNFGKNTQWAGRQLMVGFTLPLMAAGAATGYYAYQADKALTRIQKVYDTTVNSNLSLQEQAIDKERQLAQLRNDGMATAKNSAKAYGAALQDTLATQGDLAATGQKGRELQVATTQTMRLATLGEMDYQTAVQASISLQSVFSQSSEELTKSFNYMNAVENQTSLSMQDFATAIPIAAAPIKALGGDVQDLGTLLVAMKARGIDASEGANAIKSAFTRLLNPFKTTKALFKEMTGKDIDALVEKTGGELIPTLQAVGDAVKGLDQVSKARVLGKLFGTYQNTRITAMLSGVTEDMNKAGTQVSRAVDLAKSTDEELAGVADSELQRMQNSASGRLKIAVESIKVDLAAMGQGFLESAIDILNGAENIIEAFQKMPGPLKGFLKWMVIIVGAIGPLAMLTGLFFNMVGTVGKAAGSLGMMLTKFKLLNRDSVLAEKAAAAATTAMDRQTKSVDSLAMAVAGLNKQLLEAARANGALTASTNTAVARKGIAQRTERLRQEGAQVNQKTGNVSAMMKGADGRTRRKNLNQRSEQARLIRQADYKYTDNGGVPFAKVQTFNEAHEEARRVNNGKNAMQARREAEAQAVATQRGVQEENRRRQAINASKVGAGLLTASLVASLVPLGEGSTKSAELKNNLVTGAMAAGLLLPAIGAVAGAMKAAKVASGSLSAAFAGNAMVKNARGFGSALGTAARGAGDTGKRMTDVRRVLMGGTGLLNPWVLGLAAAGAASLLIYKNLKKGRDEARKFNDDASGLAKVFGFTEIEQGVKVDEKTGEKVKSLTTQVRELNREYPGLAESIRNAGSEQEKFNAAAFQGQKAFNAGASIDQAKEVVKAALAAGTSVAQSEKILMRFEFDPEDIDQQIEIITSKIKSGVESGKGPNINPFGDYGQSELAAAGKSAAAQMQKFMDSGDATGAENYAKKMIDEFNASIKGKGTQDKVDAMKDFLNGYADAMGTPESSKRLIDAMAALNGKARDGIKGSGKGLNLGDFVTLDPAGMLKDLEKTRVAVNVWRALMNSDKNPLSGLSDDKFSKKNQEEAIDAMLKGKELTEDQETTLRTLSGVLGFRRLTEEQIASILANQTDEMANQSPAAAKVEKERQSLLAGLQKGLAGLDNQSKNENAALEKRQKATMAGLEASQQAQEARLEAASRAMEARHQKASRAQELRQDKEQKAFDKRWDKRIKKEKDAEALRQRMFDAERNRIQRLAELQNANINFNAALQSGNLDEAARVQNTQRASTETNNLDDLDKRLGDKSAQRTDRLESQRDVSGSALKARQEREQWALKKHQEREKAALDATKRRHQQAAQAAKAAAEAGFQSQKDALAREQAIRKANLEKAIKDVTTYDAKTDGPWSAYLKKLRDKYGTFSGAAKKALEDAMKKAFRNTNAAADSFSGKKRWSIRADDAYQGWISGTSKAAAAKKVTKEVKGALNNIFKGFANHEGGMAFQGRTGYPANAAPYPSEHLRLLKNDEYVMKGSAVRAYGKATFDEMNKATPNTIKAHHKGGLAGTTSDYGQIPMQAYTGRLFAAASAKNKKDEDARKRAAAAKAKLAGGANRGNVDPKGWNSPWKGHYSSSNGHDWGLPKGTPIYAPHSGVAKGRDIRGVETRRAHGGFGYRSYGRIMEVTGGGANISFAHMSTRAFNGPKKVKAGQFLGKSGETGNTAGAHVHMELNHGGNNSGVGAFFRNRGVSLRKGGTLKYDNTSVNAHKGETVLTDKLTERFKEGITGLANSSNTEYNINVDATGATRSDADFIAQKVMEKIRFEKSRKGNDR